MSEQPHSVAVALKSLNDIIAGFKARFPYQEGRLPEDPIEAAFARCEYVLRSPRRGSRYQDVIAAKGRLAEALAAEQGTNGPEAA